MAVAILPARSPAACSTRPPLAAAAPQVVLYAATKGYLDKVPTNKMTAAEAAILAGVDKNVFKVLKGKGKITPELDAHLKQQISKVQLPA